MLPERVLPVQMFLSFYMHERQRGKRRRWRKNVIVNVMLTSWNQWMNFCKIHLLDSQMAVGHRSLLTLFQSSVAKYELSWNRLVSASKLIETSMVWFPFSVHYRVCNPGTFCILHCWSIYVASERRYQLEVLERAWKENIILYLECWLRCSPVRILTAVTMATEGHLCDICAWTLQLGTDVKQHNSRLLHRTLLDTSARLTPEEFGRFRQRVALDGPKKGRTRLKQVSNQASIEGCATGMASFSTPMFFILMHLLFEQSRQWMLLCDRVNFLGSEPLHCGKSPDHWRRETGMHCKRSMDRMALWWWRSLAIG